MPNTHGPSDWLFTENKTARSTNANITLIEGRDLSLQEVERLAIGARMPSWLYCYRAAQIELGHRFPWTPAPPRHSIADKDLEKMFEANFRVTYPDSRLFIDTALTTFAMLALEHDELYALGILSMAARGPTGSVSKLVPAIMSLPPDGLRQRVLRPLFGRMFERSSIPVRSAPDLDGRAVEWLVAREFEEASKPRSSIGLARLESIARETSLPLWAILYAIDVAAGDPRSKPRPNLELGIAFSAYYSQKIGTQPKLARALRLASETVAELGDYYVMRAATVPLITHGKEAITVIVDQLSAYANEEGERLERRQRLINELDELKLGLDY